METFGSVDELRSVVGGHLGESGWHTITPAEVDLFAEATGDDQSGQVDPERARTGPSGETVTHGYLILSLIPQLVRQIFCVEGIELCLSYGTDRVRFPASLPVGSRVRASAVLVSLEPARARGGFLEILRVTVEQEGGTKPVCVADTLVILFPDRAGRA